MLIMLCIIFIVTGPLLSLLFLIINEVSGSGLKEITGFLSGERKVTLLIRTIIYSAETAFFCGLISVLAGSFLYCVKNSLIKKIKWIFLFSLPIPPYIHALVWWKMFFYINKFLTSVGIQELATRGYGISLFTQIMAYLPIAMVFVMISFETVEKRLVEQSKMLIPEKNVFIRTVLRLSLPGILFGMGIVYILTFNDYSISSIFSENLYSLETFVVFSSTNNPGLASISSLPGMFITLVLMTGILVFIKKAQYKPELNFKKEKTELKLKPLIHITGIICFIIMLLQLFIPVTVLIINSVDLRGIFYSIETSLSEIVHSVVIGIITALLAVFSGFFIAYCIKEKKFIKIVIAFSLILFTLPGSLLGIGMIYFWNNLLMSSLYSSILMPVFASFIRFIPVAVVVFYASFGRVDAKLTEAGRIITGRKIKLFSEIIIPLHFSSFIIAFALEFIFTIGELGATVLVVPPGINTLTIKIYNFLHYGSSDVVYGLCLFIILLCFLVVYTVSLILKKMERKRYD
jgi:iron(III) transport system permease protein